MHEVFVAGRSREGLVTVGAPRDQWRSWREFRLLSCFSFGKSADLLSLLDLSDDGLAAAGVKDALPAATGACVGAESLARADRVFAAWRETDPAAPFSGASESLVDS
jgi:hypothetical protein